MNELQLIWKRCGVYLDKLKALIAESFLFSLAMTVYEAFSAEWSKSKIVNFFKTEHIKSNESLAVRVLLSPFTFFDFLRGKVGVTLRRGLQNSFFCRMATEYTDAFFELDTRHFGLLISAAGVFCALFSLLSGTLFASASSLTIPIILIMAGTALLITKNEPLAKRRAPFSPIRHIPAAAVGAAAGALMSSTFIYGLALPFLPVALVLIFTVPVTGVYLTVALAPLMPTSMPIAALCLLSFASLIINGIVGEKRIRWRRDGCGAAVCAFMAVLLVSCVFSFSRTSSLYVWLMYFAFASFYFTVVNTVKSVSDVKTMATLFAAVGAGVSFYGVMQYIFGAAGATAWIDTDMFEDNTIRVYSTFANPNVFGEYLLLLIPITAALFLTEKKSKPRRIFWGVSLLLGCASMIFTQSRGCWLGIIFATAIFIMFYEGKILTLLPFALLAAALVVPDSILTRFTSIGNLDDSSTSYRVYIWIATVNMLKYYFPCGIGMGEGAFGIVYPYFEYNGIDAPHSHSTYLQLLVEGGVPALLAFLAVVLSFFKAVTFTYRRGRRHSFVSVMSLSLGVAMCGFLLQSFFDYTFYNYRVIAIFFTVIGLSSALSHATEREAAREG